MTMRFNTRSGWVRAMLGIGLIFFLLLQFMGPRIDNPPVSAVQRAYPQPGIQLPDSIQVILKRACYDCHSNATHLAWFDRIAPASWLVADHVRKGRAALNFSEWDHLTAVQQRAALFESFNQLEFGLMPLQQYTWLHPGAKPNPADLRTVRAWLTTLFVNPREDTAKTGAWTRQYAAWIADSTAPRNPTPGAAPNGIAFMPNYKNWTAIAATERADNGTMRIIAGNDIAIQAIKTNNTHPWPDGTALVKIIWVQLADSAGRIRTGEFRQTDFMVKNKEKYSTTGGWGFARWAKGLQLTPYGKNAHFAAECINCHNTMRNDDFVFTTPIDLALDPALEGLVIGSYIDKTTGAMSTLYSTRSSAPTLTLVTWTQQKNPHWLGSIIPGRLQSVEQVGPAARPSIMP